MIRCALMLGETNELSRVRKSDRPAFVILRGTLASPPRAAAARELGARLKKALPVAEPIAYVWHYVSHTAQDRPAAWDDARSFQVDPRNVGRLADTKEVEHAWSVTTTLLEQLGATRVVLRTPPSFHPGSTSRTRLAAFADKVRAQGLELIWEPEGLWEPAASSAVAESLGIDVMLPALDSAGRWGTWHEGRRTWRRFDGFGAFGQLRTGVVSPLAAELDEQDAETTLVFAGPFGLANMRLFLRELALLRGEQADEMAADVDDITDGDAEIHDDLPELDHEPTEDDFRDDAS